MGGPERWRRSGAVLWRVVLDDAVLLPPGAPEPVSLRGGASLWAALDQPRTVPELVRDLSGGEAPESEKGLHRLLVELASSGAVERLPA